MIKFTKTDAEKIAFAMGKKTTNESLRARYAATVSRDLSVLRALCAKLEKVSAYGSIPSVKVAGVYEPAITAIVQPNAERLFSAKKAVDEASAELAPFSQVVSAEVDAAEKRATVRNLDPECVLEAIRALHTTGKRGDTVTISTFEKLPKSYKYPQSYTVAKITRRKSDGAFTIEITRETSF